MPLTREQKKAAMKHLLEVVFDLDPESRLHKALEHNQILSPHDIMSLPHVDYDLLEYAVDDKSTHPIPKGHVGLLKAFRAFV